MAREEYIKKSDLLQHIVVEELSDFKDCDVIHADEIDELTTYSFPNSAEDNTMEWLLYGYATNEQIKNCSERYCCSKCHNIVSRDYRYFKYCPNCGRKAVSE